MADVHKKCCQRGERTHNDYIELPTEKVVANMLTTEESVCVYDGLYVKCIT